VIQTDVIFSTVWSTLSAESTLILIDCNSEYEKLTLTNGKWQEKSDHLDFGKMHYLLHLLPQQYVVELRPPVGL